MKWYVYLICFALMIAGGFCGMRLYTLITAESYINGSIDIQNQFTMESFAYTSDGIVFTPESLETEKFIFSTGLKPVDDFNGEKNTYQIVLNNYILTDVTVTAGSVYSRIYLDFYDVDGQIIQSAFMDISVRFLSNNTELTLSTTGGGNASFLTQYFDDYGIRLKINEIKGVQQ